MSVSGVNIKIEQGGSPGCISTVDMSTTLSTHPINTTNTPYQTITHVPAFITTYDIAMVATDTRVINKQQWREQWWHQQLGPALALVPSAVGDLEGSGEGRADRYNSSFLSSIIDQQLGAERGSKEDSEKWENDREKIVAGL